MTVAGLGPVAGLFRGLRWGFLSFGPAPELGVVGFTTLTADMWQCTPVALDTAVKFVTAADSVGGWPWGLVRLPPGAKGLLLPGQSKDK